MTTSVLVLGAGFGGLEVCARLSETLGDEVSITLLDGAEAFLFGFSKLDVLFGRGEAPDLALPYADLAIPGVDFRRERVTAIDPATRTVTTDAGTHTADILVVGLGAEYDPAATPGFIEDGFEFYSVEGAERLRDRLASFDGGRVVVAVLGIPFKCPPAPYEGILLLHDHLVRRGVRDASTLRIISPMPAPIPPSPTSSAAILAALEERDIGYTPGKRVRSLDPAAHVAHLSDEQIPYDLFIGIPVHRTPEVVVASGLTEGGTDGWAAVDKATLQTRFPGVYAIGDCADAPVPRAGVFALSAARALAEHVVATVRGGGDVRAFDGTGTCYLEFGGGLVGKVEADFLSGPSPVAPFLGPSADYAAEKAAWAEGYRRRWFGRG